ncbi:MAG TPA: 1,4-alpha-glucan branching protein GlgB [Actinotalea caeni]|uniref:1,4-alpha-glucan branching protein GlgB n=1 Tax=Actinotalea caeni TaxID=1348467 RepID=UPI002B4ABFFD|nr:1,4-alpha-glucan branching protein GlgB [Actinotalea caeni]HLV56469.1 1,4-alpha-glucan branching protein GlgB [Actinotalea caeni]
MTETPSSDPARAAAPVPVPAALLTSVAQGLHFAPHEVLGPHLHDGVVTVRVVRHGADAVTVLTPEGEHPAQHEQDGVWAAAFPAAEVPEYRLRVAYGDRVDEVDDGYRYLPTLGDVDLHLVREGRHERLWGALGAHVRRYPTGFGEVVGTSFAVWAPNARAVRVIGDFNGWDGRATSMRSLGDSGVWELFVPHVGKGTRYKFEIITPDGTALAKADPLARAAEVPPATASVVTESEYSWSDDEWMQQRAQRDPHTGPMSIYEVHLGSWRQGLGYRELADQLTEYVTWMGFTHVELMPVSEHPFGGSWGYQVSSYYAPTSRFGDPDDFRYLVDRLHGAGIGVILDWVPAHFPKDDWALARFDGTPLYEDPDPLRGEQLDWGTYVFNFGRNEVRNFLVANAVYWLTEFHVDGLRVDAVASMLYLDYSRQPGQWRPNVRGGRENLEAIQFLQEANATAYRSAPGIVMIAEESTAWPGVTAPTDAGGLGFGLKWNMGWMNDTLRYLAEEPINRRYHHGELTFSLVYAFSEQYVLPLSHDEVVHGKGSLLRKMPGDRWQQLAGLRALFAYMWTHPGKNLIFMGDEFGQETEWAESRSLEWEQGDSPEHAGVRRLVRDLNHFYVEHPALWADDFSHAGFQWLEAGDGDHNTISYLRLGGGETVAVVVNFAGVPHEDYRVALPHGGDWLEALNTDAADYGGSGVGNLGRVRAEPVPWAGRSHSAVLRVPPLGAVLLVPADDAEA